MSMAPLLAAFLRRYQSSFLDGLEAGLAHIRYPAGYGTLLGSERGRAFWDTAESNSVVSAIMGAQPFSGWFDSDSPLAEMEVKRALASFVARWLGTNLSPQEFVASYGLEFQEDFAIPEVKVIAYQIAYGLSLDLPYVELPFGFALSQASPEVLSSLFMATNNPTLRVIREPNLPALFLVNAVVAERAQWRSIASSAAMGFAITNLLRLRKALWLNTNVVVNLGDTFYFQDSKYPSLPPERMAASSTKVFRSHEYTVPVAQSSVQTLTQLLPRLASIWGYLDYDGANRPTTQAALDALEHAEAAIDSANPRFATLMSYVGLECLLTREGEKSTHLSRRVRQLISDDQHEQRQMGRALDAIYKVRRKIAHGQQPDRADLETASGQPFSSYREQEEWCWKALAARCLTLLRRTVVAYLFTTIDASSKERACSVSHLLDRDELLNVLDEAARNNLQCKERVREYVPDIARYPVVGNIR